MNKQYEDQFSKIFRSESLRGERIHCRLNWFLYTTILVLSSFVYFFQSNEAGRYGIILSILNLLYNVFVTLLITREKSVVRISYITMFLNVLSLTIYDYVDAVSNSTIVITTTAAVLIYPVIIFLASLRMDKYLIIWTSILCILSMDGLYIWFYGSFDPYIAGLKISTDALSQIYRTVYLIIISILIYSVPRSMRRILRTQERLAKESFENKQNAQHDPLTGLYNRLYFEQHLADCIEAARGSNQKFALLFIDLDGFKQLNDAHGHDLGDYILKSIAEDVASSIRESDLVARIGGDEFIIILSQINTVREVKSFSYRVLAAITRKRMYRNTEISISASIGIALFPDDSDNMEQLIKCADEAMYAVKRSGKEGVVFYRSISQRQNSGS